MDLEELRKEVDAEMMSEGRAGFCSSDSISSAGSFSTSTFSIPGRTIGPTRRSTKGGWTQEEDEALARVVKIHNGKHWKKIAESFPGRSDVQCLHRWQKVLNPDLIKGPWTKEEDDLIIQLVEKYGCKKWSVISQSLPGRIGKQCRERWHNHLNPSIKKDPWTKEEELTLIRAHNLYGNKWAEIARLLPGRVKTLTSMPYLLTLTPSAAPSTYQVNRPCFTLFRKKEPYLCTFCTICTKGLAGFVFKLK